MNTIACQVNQRWFWKARVEEKALKGHLDLFNCFVFTAVVRVYIKPQ